MMNDYISRQAAMNAFAEYVRRSNNSDFAPTPTWNNAVEIVENLQSADAVEVVRCKDCNHSYVFEPWEGINAVRYCKIYKNRYGDADMCVEDDDFCSYGERKDGDADEKNT